MTYAIAFSQLGIPMEAMGVVFVVDMIIDFPAVACNVSGWQLVMVDVADSLDMLDKETLCKKR
jgi:L-cystine uptake protein TcyP (sodium:dicarboxylate symporter family)